MNAKLTVIAALLAAAPVTSLAFAGAAIAAPASPAANNSNYSMTQDVTNDSSQPWTLTSYTVDNGGTLQPGYPTTVAAHSSGTYKATNHGNGVQLTLTFTTPNGATVTVDSDTPKVNGDWSKAAITGSGLGFDNGSFSMSGGDNPTATMKVNDCTDCCSTTVNNNGGIVA